MTSRCGSWNGSDSSSTARTTEKMAVFAPMPSARQRIASTVVSRAFQSERSAKRMSWTSVSIYLEGGGRPAARLDKCITAEVGTAALAPQLRPPVLWIESSSRQFTEIHMRRVGQGATVLCAVVAIGCSAGSDVTDPRLNAAATGLSSRDARPERVTGSATVLLPQFGNALERYSVSAIRQKDGSVTGELEEFSEQEGGQRIHARVYCFTVTRSEERRVGKEC